MTLTREERMEVDGAVDPVLFYGADNEWGEFSSFGFWPITLMSPWTLQPVTYT